MASIVKLPDRVSLASLDEGWRACLAESIPGQIGSSIGAGLKAMLSSESLSRLGNWCQSLSFGIMVLLFAIIGLHNFVNDKVVLALVCLGGLALWSLGCLLGGKERRTPTAVDALVLLYLAANVVATFASHYFSESLDGLSKVVVFVASYFYFTAILEQSDRRKVIVVSALLLCTMCMSLFGLYQYKIGVAPLATWEDPSVLDKTTRIYSTLDNPNLLAGFLVPTVALALGLAFAALASRRYLIALPPAAVAAAALIACLLTGSRGSYIALAAVFGVLGLIAASWFFVKLPPRLKPVPIVLLGLGIIAMIAAVILIPSLHQRVLSIFAGSEHSSNAYRMTVYRASLDMFKDNWWFGVGPGNKAFRLAYGLYMRSGFDALGTYCVPLEVAVECGIVGLIIFTGLIASCLARAHMVFWSSQNSLSRWLSAGTAAALVGLMAHGMTDTVFYRPQVQFIFWLAVALAVSIHISVSKSARMVDA